MWSLQWILAWADELTEQSRFVEQPRAGPLLGVELSRPGAVVRVVLGRLVFSHGQDPFQTS